MSRIRTARLPIERLARHRRALASLAPALTASLALACSPTHLGATDAQLASAQSHAGAGAAVYSAKCARCHGTRGQGLADSPELMGPGALPEYPRDLGSSNVNVTDPQQLQIQQQTRPQGAPWRDPFRNAQDVFDFVKTHLPKGTVTPEDDWAVVTYVLTVQGAIVPQEGITADNAGTVAVPH
jgi:mono/diheme cytochrome c family protein